jgi:poly-beta-hydroxyalkanoate depolymerase
MIEKKKVIDFKSFNFKLGTNDKRLRRFIFLFLITLFLSCNAIISSAYSDFSFTSRVSQGSDDAEEHVHNGYIDYTSSDLELVLDQCTQTIGLRFKNIQVPNGATITNAYVEFETDETGSTSTDLTFYV